MGSSIVVYGMRWNRTDIPQNTGQGCPMNSRRSYSNARLATTITELVRRDRSLGDADSAGTLETAAPTQVDWFTRGARPWTLRQTPVIISKVEFDEVALGWETTCPGSIGGEVGRLHVLATGAVSEG